MAMQIAVDRSRPPVYIPVLYTVLAIFIALILAPSRYLNLLQGVISRAFIGKIPSSSRGPPLPSMDVKKTPVFFISHGGPNIMYETAHPVYSKLQEIGREITQKVKPRAVVVFSAHWEGQPEVISVNTAEKTDLIYDFYNFPADYYKETYPNRGSTSLAERVLSLLKSSGIKAVGTSRGLDHGVWAPFKVLFSPETNPLKVPLVQVSLFATEDPNQHYALGRAVSSLRQEGIAIIVSGMAVHNLRDYGASMRSPVPLPYAESFDQALFEAVTIDAEHREESMARLLKRSDARKAHPTFEHLLPLYVGAGAALEDKAVRLWTMPEGSMSWAQYRFGNISV